MDLFVCLQSSEMCIFYVFNYRPDTQHIFVDVGFGFHVEFTWSEALNYIEKREEKIARYKFLIQHTNLPS